MSSIMIILSYWYLFMELMLYPFIRVEWTLDMTSPQKGFGGGGKSWQLSPIIGHFVSCRHHCQASLWTSLIMWANFGLFYEGNLLMKNLSYLTQQPSLSISVGRLFTFIKSFYFQFEKVKLNCSSSSSTHNGIGNPDPKTEFPSSSSSSMHK